MRTHAPNSPPREKSLPILGDTSRPRHDAVATIASWLDRAQSGALALGVIEGSSGMGKSTLARQAKDMGDERGFAAVFVRGQHVDTVSFARLQMCRQLGLPERVPESTAVVQIRIALQELEATNRSVLLVFDDLQHFTAFDLALLQDLVRDPPCRRLAIICTRRSRGDERAVGDNGIRLPEIDAAERILLPALSLQETAAVIRECTSTDVPDRFIHDLRKFTGGNPRYVAALTGHLARLHSETRDRFLAGSQLIEAILLPESLVDSVHSQLNGLAAAQRDVLDALAIFKMPASMYTIGHLVEEATDDVESAIDSLERRGLVQLSGPVSEPLASLSEPIMASALQSGMPLLRRRRLHRRAAETLEAQPQKLSADARLALAEHLVTSSVAITADRASMVLTAAEFLIQHSRYAAAFGLITRLFDRAREDTSSELTPPAGAFVMLTETLSRLGASTEARRALPTVKPTQDDEFAVGVLIRLARDHVASGQPRLAADVYSSLLTEHRISTSQRARILSDFARVTHMLGDPQDALTKLGEATRLNTAASNSELLTDSLSHQAFILTLAGFPRSALGPALRGRRLARHVNAPSLVARATLAIGYAIADLTSEVRGARWLAYSLRLAETSEDYATLSAAAYRLASAYIELGEWREANRVATLSAQIAGGLHRQRALKQARAMRSLVAALQGGPVEAIATGRREEGGFHDPAVTIPELIANFEAHMHGGRRDKAHEAVDAAYNILRTTRGWERLLLIEVLPRRASAFAASGDRLQVAGTVDEFEQISRSHPELAPLCHPLLMFTRAQLAQLEERWEEAARLAHEAASALGDRGYRWRQALALREAARAWYKTKDVDSATPALEAAYQAFSSMGHASSLSEIRTMLMNLGHGIPRRAARPDVLTERQWQIAELARQGLTDRRIADSLGVSRRTVTTHMQNIFRITGLNSRSALSEWVQSHHTERGSLLS